MSVYQNPFKSITLVPGVDLTTHRYKAVSVDETGKGVLATEAGAAVGILQEPNEVGQPANVMVSGISFAVCAGAVQAGDAVEVGADGKVAKLTTGIPIGICLVGGADKELCSILLK